MPDNTIRGRFAPSPSGRLHLGNMLTFLLAWLDVRALGGTMVFRLEDLDPERSWEHYADVRALPNTVRARARSATPPRWTH